MKTLLFTFMCILLVSSWWICQAQDPNEPDCDYIGYSPFTLREEICGSDGQTYSNEKHLEFENCLYRRAVTKVKNGWCKEEDQKRAEEQRQKFVAEQTKKLQAAQQAGKASAS